MTPPKDQAPGLVARLRDPFDIEDTWGAFKEAADLIEQQAARIEYLEKLQDSDTKTIETYRIAQRNVLAQLHEAKTLHDTPPHKGLIREQCKPEDEG